MLISFQWVTTQQMVSVCLKVIRRAEHKKINFHWWQNEGRKSRSWRTSTWNRSRNPKIVNLLLWCSTAIMGTSFMQHSPKYYLNMIHWQHIKQHAHLYQVTNNPGTGRLKSEELLTGSTFSLKHLSIVLFLPLCLFLLISSLSHRILLLTCLSISPACISSISGNSYAELLFILQHCSLLTSLEKQAAQQPGNEERLKSQVTFKNTSFEYFSTSNHAFWEQENEEDPEAQYI